MFLPVRANKAQLVKHIMDVSCKRNRRRSEFHKGISRCSHSKADAENAELLTWAVSTQFPDVIGEGSLGYLLFGQPYKIIDSNNPALEEPGTSYHAEAGLKFAVNKNISITPGVFWIINPEHNNANTDTVVGVVRTTFKF